MAFADAVQRMRDRQYATMGAPARWTAAGGLPLAFTALLVGEGDQVGQLRDVVAQFVTKPLCLRARATEFATLAPGVTPLDGDLFDLLDANGAVIASYQASGDPKLMHARRDEWEIELADG